MLNEYNTNDLMFGRYVYSYEINNGDEVISIAGERMGVLYFSDKGYYDLITSSYILEDNILMKKPFNAKDNKLEVSTIKGVFKGIEEICEYMATERQVDEDNLCPNLPSVITFKASEMNRCLESMYGLDNFKNQEDKTSSKPFIKLKNKFKRK